MHAFVIAGTHSGSGKTTISLGIMASLVKRGLSVQPFKSGPDFIDSGLHRLATGKVSRNLDLWMCGPDYVKSSFARASADADVAVVEGVMGLYDGNCSTASLASLLDLPVVLVVDGYGMAESAGPMVKGFVDWESPGNRKNTVRGVIFNRVASDRHFKRLSADVRGVPVLGYLPRNADFEIPHRHLGLVTAEEEPVSAAGFSRLADAIAGHVDLDRLLELAEKKKTTGRIRPIGPVEKKPSARPVRIGVALDKAFCFYYRDNLDLLEEAGASLLFFSPLADRVLPDGIDAVYLGGGYPELYVGPLSLNSSMRSSILDWAESGGPLYAECGGLMYLSSHIVDFDNHSFPMAGVLPFRTIMTRGRARLGYRQAVLKADCLIGRAGATVRGHEFHYSTMSEGTSGPLEHVYEVTDGSGNVLGAEGVHYGNTIASYIHVHFGSNPSIAPSMIEFARERRSA